MPEGVPKKEQFKQPGGRNEEKPRERWNGTRSENGLEWKVPDILSVFVILIENNKKKQREKYGK